MNLRRCVFGILTIGICMSMSFVYAEDIVEKNDVISIGMYDSVVKDFVGYYANCVDNGIEFISGRNVSKEINDYLSIQEKTIELYQKKDNYNVTTEILEKDVIDNTIYYKVNVRANWVYNGAAFDSGYAKDVDVLVDKNSGNIIDLYDINSFTLAVRGEVDIRDESNVLTKEIVSTAAEKYEKKISAAKKQIEEDVKKDKENQNNIERSVNRSNFSWIDHDKVVQWARANYNKANPTSGRPGVVSYYDFSQISGAYDCTNFISHALLAGEARIYNTGNSSTGWWFTSTSNRSYSWSGVNEFYNFTMNNTTRGPGGHSMTWTQNYDAWSLGDIFQFNNGSIWRHSTVITGFVMESNGLTIPCVTGRTSATSNNNNIDVREHSYSAYPKRVLHLYNYGA